MAIPIYKVYTPVLCDNKHVVHHVTPETESNRLGMTSSVHLLFFCLIVAPSYSGKIMTTYYCFLLHASLLENEVEIEKGPESITDATLGDTVIFNCTFTCEDVIPHWTIDGDNYGVVDLPDGYSFNDDLPYVKQLIVGPLTSEMNNSTYSCYAVDPSQLTHKSKTAFLIISKLCP